jgi:hypothetical protein
MTEDNGVGYGQYPVGHEVNPYNPVLPPQPPSTELPPPSNIITVLSYDYENAGGQPPAGACYQSSSALALVSISNRDNNATDQTAFLGAMNVNDMIGCNGVTWTITAIQIKGSNVLYTVTPAVAAPPEGVTDFTFTQVAGKR